MSRKIPYNINRFDGGITTDIRNTSDLSKCAHVSHFDIYRDKNRLIPLPGYVDDMNDGSTSTGMQTYNIKAFTYDGALYAVGLKSNGTGSKLWKKDAPTDASWTAVSSGEGTYDLSDYTFLRKVGSRYWFLTENGGSTYFSYYAGSVTDTATVLESFALTNYIVPIHAFDNVHYINTGQTGVDQINSTSITADAKSTAMYTRALASGDEQIGIFGNRFYPYRSQLITWDSASSLADQKYEFGSGRAAAVGYIDGVWIGVVDENLGSDNAIFNEEANNQYSVAIKKAYGSGTKEIARLFAATNTNGVVRPLEGNYRGNMIFYARIPQDATPTTYKEGIWCVGRSTETSPIALSLLVDTADLGSLEGFFAFGKHMFFAHGGDGSISRLDAFDGTYDVTAVYESLVFGANSPNKKTLNGLSVQTEDLPSGASVVAKYRTDTDDSWTTLATSSTVGTEIHNFTRTSSGQVGTFQEIQFRIEVTGNAPIKSIYCSLEELDTTPYDS